MLDGIGLSEQKSNPFGGQYLPALAQLGIATQEKINEENINKKVLRSLDACLGVEGLPQSGTGQTTLLCGINAAQLMGRHYGPWPGPTLIGLIEKSLPVQVQQAGGSVKLANYYPPQYFEAIKNGKQKRGAIPLACILAGATQSGHIPPPFDTLNKTESVSLQTVRQWGNDFASSNATLNIFDAWWSDHIGHMGSKNLEAIETAREHARRLDMFCQGILEALPEDALFLLTSDHGNFENMSVKTHTFANVPLAAIGKGAEEFAGLTDLTGVAPAILKVMGLARNISTGC